MAILGHLFIVLPVFFEVALILPGYDMAIFPDTVGNARIYLLHFYRLIGIKRRARLIPKAHIIFDVLPLPAGLNYYVGLWVVFRGGRGGDSR
ncbi:hypothetical protein ACIPDS_07285 [Kluyvera sp. NPDC087067]|jgi:hypothetical protein|uniref:hypothetical protein n=1 Tax=unclassified Kluyvera TaxID=2619995 RepID=UPI0038110D51